jgi:hypothetical protein
MKLGPCQPQINRKDILLGWAFGLVLLPISPTLDQETLNIFFFETVTSLFVCVCAFGLYRQKAEGTVERSMWLLRVDLERQRRRQVDLEQRQRRIKPEQCRSMSCSGGPTPSDDALTPNGGSDALTRMAVAVP